MQGMTPVAVSVGVLWLPILLSAVLVFVGSSVIWTVFKYHVVGATRFLAYGAGQFVDSIWFYRSWRTTWLNVLDALIYCGLTAGTFGWLWPR